MCDVRQLADDIRIVQFGFERAQYLLLACGTAKVDHQVGMARTHILKCSGAGEMVWPRWNIQALVGIDVTGFVADIVWIIVIGDGMQHIDIDASYSVDHLNEAIQAYPRVVVDGDAKILEISKTTSREATDAITL